MRGAFFLLSTVFITCFPGLIFANSAPVVSNVTVSQRTDGSKLVDIRYSLSDADGDRCTVSVQVSSDGGSTWTVPAVTFLPGSAIGPIIQPGMMGFIPIHPLWTVSLPMVIVFMIWPAMFGNGVTNGIRKRIAVPVRLLLCNWHQQTQADSVSEHMFHWKGNEK